MKTKTQKSGLTEATLSPQDFWQQWKKTFAVKENEITPEELYQLAYDYAEYKAKEYAKKEALKERSDLIEYLEKYSLFLEKEGYMDTDWRAEEPFAIDKFLGSNETLGN